MLGKGTNYKSDFECLTVLGLKIKLKYNTKCFFSLNQCIFFPHRFVDKM